MPEKIYIASAYTIGDVAINVKRQHDAYEALRRIGLFPLAPLWSHYQHMHHPRSWDDWIETALIWLQTCDTIIRIPGESRGADIEMANAASLGLTCLHDWEDARLYLSSNYQRNDEAYFTGFGMLEGIMQEYSQTPTPQIAIKPIV